MTPELTDYLATTDSDLGPDADERDLATYNATLTRAWETVQPLTAGAARKLAENVLEGRHGDWVAEAEASRAAAALGRKGGTIGGKSTSRAKAEAARANGAKGGRPLSLSTRVMRVSECVWGAKNDERLWDGWRAHGDEWAAEYLRKELRRGVDIKGDASREELLSMLDEVSR